MDPRALGHADARLHQVDEGGGVVVGGAFALVHLGHEGGVHHGTARAQRGHVGGGDDPARAQALGGEQLHLEHGVETVLVAEEPRDVGG